MNLLQRSITMLCIATIPGALAAMPDDALVKVLRDGAITIYFRHASTDHSQIDRKDVAPEDCANQRNLSEQGRAEARAIGAAIRALGLVLEDEVVSSPYCRTMETARLITGRASGSRVALGTRGAGGRIDYSSLAKLFVNPPPKGRIRVVVSHGNQLYEMTRPAGPEELLEGQAAIIVGNGESYRVLDTIAAADWPRLAALATPPAR